MQQTAEPSLSHCLTMNDITALTSDEYQAMEDEFRSILTENHIPDDWTYGRHHWAYTQLLYMVIKHERDTIIGLQLTIDEMRGDA